MIVTFTPNPSLDRTISLDRLQRGQVHRAIALRDDPGGKGVNVSRALAAHGTDTLAVLPVGIEAARTFSALLEEAGVDFTLVDLPGALRTNVTLAEADGTTTKINEPGRESTAADAATMLDALEAPLRGASWVVGCGSLPPGLDGTLYADLVRRAHALGVRVAIDTSGQALSAAIAAAPDLVKPNVHELAEHAGRPLPHLEDVLRAAHEVLDAGVTTVLVSMGAQGAMAVTRDGVSHAIAVASQPRSTVAAGDCLLAGWLHAVAHGAGRDEALATAVRWGTAAVELPGSQVPGPAQSESVTATLSPALDTQLTMTHD
ncbi:1-phosphofructokinase [Demequina activiva]|uniref:1-phosphofructokinase n=1 Tax=Demequina activiva TaxID=1582364 RepID=A0A919PZF3_9MICO|nr:1-phosphofructokinase [Demequina activiva]GIG53520.1 1-phosphofructokinase [Demequina activiva]